MSATTSFNHRAQRFNTLPGTLSGPSADAAKGLLQLQLQTAVHMAEWGVSAAQQYRLPRTVQSSCRERQAGRGQPLVAQEI